MPSATGLEGVGDHLNGHHHMNFQSNNSASTVTSTSGGPPVDEVAGIRDVWAHNLREEFFAIRGLCNKSNYNFIAIDTEFPGVVARPIGEFRCSSEYQYQLLRVNCDMLRLIQLGFALMDEHGNTPQGVHTWQFNFKFNLTEDMYAQDSIELLQNSGIQFKKHETDGIDPMKFSELFITSGMVLNDNIKWISFHSGYDLGYMYRLLTDRKLPAEEKDFFEMLKLFFPFIYDVKYLMKSCKNLKGGLQEVADELEIERVGLQHQAGSDALITGAVFFRMKDMFFEDNIDEEKYNGHVYGFSTSYALGSEAAGYSQPQPTQPEHSSASAF